MGGGIKLYFWLFGKTNNPYGERNRAETISQPTMRAAGYYGADVEPPRAQTKNQQNQDVRQTEEEHVLPRALEGAHAMKKIESPPRKQPSCVDFHS